MRLTALDVADSIGTASKSDDLVGKPCILVDQSAQLTNPDARIMFTESSSGPLLSDLAISMRGIVTGDRDRWIETVLGTWDNLNRLEVSPEHS